MLSFSQTVFKVVILGAVVFLLTRPVAAVSAQEPLEFGIITAGRLHVRADPGIDNPSVIIVRKGSKVRILERIDGWLKVSYHGKIGYIRNRERYVHILPKDIPSAPKTADVPAERKAKAYEQGDIKQFKKQAEDISRKIETGRAKVLTFTQKESTIISSLDNIDLTLDSTRKRVSDLKSDLITLEKQITQTTHRSKMLVKEIEAKEEYVSKRLVSIYKLSWIGRLNVLASADALYDLFQRQKTLELILDYDRQIREKLIQDKLDLQMLLTRLNNQKREKLSLEADLSNQDQIMTEKRAKRARLLEEIRNRKSLEMAAIESLKQAAENLDRMIRSLGPASGLPDAVKKRSPKNFILLKGLLNMPVKGKISYFFGPYKNEKFGVVNFHSGILIKADRGEPIRAVCDGRVLYANWLKGYGNMIIIDHGDSYYTVYAHAEELFTSKGDTIEKGDVVATVGDTGSLVGPGLHFEVRHHGKPVDPLKWMKKG